MTAVALLLALGGCTSPTRANDGPVVETRPVALHSQQPERVAVGRLRLEAGYVLSSGDGRFGGFSGLWIAADGSRLMAASDHGNVWSAALEHDADDRLVGLGDWTVTKPTRPAIDRGIRGINAEALAADGDGGLVIAYEGAHRLRRWPIADLAAAPAILPTPDRLDAPGNQGNEGIEALATLGDGTLLALAEGAHDRNGDLLAWLIGPDRVETLSYASVDGFAPTGADRLGDTIYVVERAFSLFGGFRARIVTLPADDVRAGARLTGTELARLAYPLTVDNFEALAARRARDGRVLLYLLSDDNFVVLQRTLLLQFSLAPEIASGRSSDGVGRTHEGAEGQ